MNDKTIVTKDLANKTLIIERAFKTTKEKLWKAYSQKDMFEAWWGPEGWKTTTKEFNFSEGGRIHYGMKCVDPNQGEWFEKESWGLMVIEKIDAPNMFSAADYFCSPDAEVTPGMPAQKFEVEFVEEAEAGKVRLVSRSIVDSVEKLEELIGLGMVEGFDSQLNKLEALLQA